MILLYNLSEVYEDFSHTCTLSLLFDCDHPGLLHNMAEILMVWIGANAIAIEFCVYIVNKSAGCVGDSSRPRNCVNKSR